MSIVMNYKQQVCAIRKHHRCIAGLDKTIDCIGKQQIQAAFEAGKLLIHIKFQTPSNGWGKWCKSTLPDISQTTLDRYARLARQSVLTECIEKYRTLYEAYKGEGIMSEQTRITVKPPLVEDPTNTAPKIAGKESVYKDVLYGGLLSSTLKKKSKIGGTVKGLLNTLKGDARKQMIETLLKEQGEPTEADFVPSNVEKVTTSPNGKVQTTTYRNAPLQRGMSRSAKALGLIHDLADVLNEDTTLTTDNLMIYNELDLIKKWRKTILDLSNEAAKQKGKAKGKRISAYDIASKSKVSVDIGKGAKKETVLTE